ncbi:hypothetical protein ebA2197 [Aromatoleum aromaticum EbN1]|uniref:Uncharacterized protein n=1 Tax=Aromatoleum aromaticum (strain DSM 19018 / LMG 30748 / EbN1) TaxID=76114 RepID=Q5P5S3_AROAE|nr:hypothetical protein ebA2197 [Aromatoleum aromaticum EbN1]
MPARVASMRLLNAGDNPAAAAVAGFREMPPLVELDRRRPCFFADQAVKTHADEVTLRLLGIADDLRLQIDHFGTLDNVAAFLDLHLQFREHFRRDELTQVVEVARVVRRLQAHEVELRLAHEGLRIESCRKHAGTGRRSRSGCRSGCRSLGLHRDRAAARPGSGVLHRRRCRAFAHHEAEDGEGGHRQQRDHQDVRKSFAHAQVRSERRETEACGKAGQRTHPAVLFRSLPRRGSGIRSRVGATRHRRGRRLRRRIPLGAERFPAAETFSLRVGQRQAHAQHEGEKGEENALHVAGTPVA